MNYAFPVRFEPDPDGGFGVYFRDVPEAITGGETLDEAREMAAEALGLALRGLLVMDREVPKPSRPGRDENLVAVPAGDALKIALIEAFRQSGITKTAFGNTLGKSEAEARRLLDPDHPSKLPAMEAALAALGRRVVIQVEAA